ncbi:PEBP-like protein [Collybia nuda]|uniref:PEBP-like protein n=1 Tax=Collybia nuda TaxID=64659 RepID=A0A9P6CDT2_9AGAR|nr:PEBP-like protein [Collybia nuda]
MTSQNQLSGVVAALKEHELIPDILPVDFSPSLLFSVVWPNGKEVALSNELTPVDTVEEPDVRITVPVSGGDESAAEASYTLVMVDPDAPSRAEPIYRQFRHWVITGLKLESGVAKKTKASTTPYRPPGPRPASGLHRYTFLLFEEPKLGYTIPEGAPEYGAALEERRSWNAVDFGKRYGLKLVGANFFLVWSTQ